jgi:hypothetical protein
MIIDAVGSKKVLYNLNWVGVSEMQRITPFGQRYIKKKSNELVMLFPGLAVAPHAGGRGPEQLLLRPSLARPRL